jgi:hypothetical protein
VAEEQFISQGQSKLGGGAHQSKELNSSLVVNTTAGKNMDEALRSKLDEARKRMNIQQAGINADRKDDDPAMRQWARGKQKPANAERAEFRNSLTDEERSQIEERIEQLVRDNPTLSQIDAESKTEPEPPPPPPLSAELLEEYHFLRDMVV